MTVAAHSTAATVVVGLGASGLASVRHLRALGRRVTVMDTRPNPPHAEQVRREYPEVALQLGALDAATLAGAEEIVLSPGVDPRLPALREAGRQGRPVIGEIELFAREVTAPVIGITGSNGKSTVTRMLAAMAAAAHVPAATGGNLGPPALTLLAQQPDAPLYILELSSFQLESTRSLAPLAAAVLNLSPDHLDRYAGMSDYAAAKARILRGAQTAVLNADDVAVRAMAQAGQSTVWFTGAETSTPDNVAALWSLAPRAGETWICRAGQPFMPRQSVAAPGRHNAVNALAALALGEAAGFSADAMRHGLATFGGLPHRLETLGERQGRLWVNDSKATNVGAAVAAIQSMTAPVVLLAGGDGKGQVFAPLAQAMAPRGRAVVAYGRDGDRIAAAFGDQLPVQRVDDLDAAVAAAHALSQAGDAVLLAPACASLDQFADYRARGERFRARVEALGDE